MIHLSGVWVQNVIAPKIFSSMDSKLFSHTWTTSQLTFVVVNLHFFLLLQSFSIDTNKIVPKHDKNLETWDSNHAEIWQPIEPTK